MKLVHQINVAFALALVLVLSVTAVVIHYVLLDHFIQTQKEDLKTMGSQMVASIQLNKSELYPIEELKPALTAMATSSTADVEAVFTDTSGNTIHILAPNQISTVNINSAISVSTPSTLQSISSGTDKRYITDINVTPKGTLTLYTPVSKVKAIEQALLGRLLIVFCTAGAFMLLFSLYITKKLIHPLMKLRSELKKVKDRHFSEVHLIKAGGEIGAVAQSVYDMAGELNRFNHVQKQFFQNASHELKTPLMSISGYAEGIKDGIFEGEQVQKGLDIIMSESGRLKRLVTEMTLLAKLDSEEDVFQTTDVCLKELLTETVERMNPIVVKRGLTLHISYDDQELLLIHADKDKLLQALLNVISNATRYANHHIYIHAITNQGRIELTISDDGAGISEDLLPYLFHRFVKGKDGESGLGLAISRAIVERCGGCITAENRRESGAIITLGLPIAAST
ncbi:sensor histidine kinase [Paenibacillus pini]|uniref:histidine kinase n=1 Tax=Paenibacillus pini JCM 16418 TaxID=1236976 RepID=W7YE95_9BACL|nr:HAMP domain-containing sensor histidine kinase [Paenibacillus pini]GAF09245.1 sensor histidine kinase [Paenibacillus pini JCM 16418]